MTTPTNMTQQEWTEAVQWIREQSMAEQSLEKQGEQTMHERCLRSFDIGKRIEEPVYAQYGKPGFAQLVDACEIENGRMEDYHYVYWGAMRSREIVEHAPSLSLICLRNLGYHFRWQTDLLSFTIQFNLLHNPACLTGEGVWATGEKYAHIRSALCVAQENIRDHLGVGYIIDLAQTNIVDRRPIVKCPGVRPGDQARTREAFEEMHKLFTRASEIAGDDGILIPAGLFRRLHPAAPDLAFTHEPHWCR